MPELPGSQPGPPPGPLASLISMRARQDIEDVWLHSARTWSVGQAERYVRALAATFDLICHTPELGPAHRQFVPPVRIHRHGSHLIVYRIEAGTILIDRVLHTKQNWRAILEKSDSP
jgi:toxin ParE1/3/4